MSKEKFIRRKPCIYVGSIDSDGKVIIPDQMIENTAHRNDVESLKNLLNQTIFNSYKKNAYNLLKNNDFNPAIRHCFAEYISKHISLNFSLFKNNKHDLNADTVNQIAEFYTQLYLK